MYVCLSLSPIYPSTPSTLCTSVMTFSFVDPTTGSPLVIDSIPLTFYIFDSSTSGGGVESITSADHDSYTLPSVTQLSTTTNGDGSVTFTATEEGTGDANPTDPNTLTDVQSQRSVTLYYTDLSSFSVTYGSESGTAILSFFALSVAASMATILEAISEATLS